jgi:predicted permease
MPPDITIPITAFPTLVEGNEFKPQSRSLLWLFVTGRLKNGITIEQARAQLQSFWPDVLRATASTETPGPRRERFLSMGLEVSSAAKGFTSGLRSDFARPLYVLAGVVGLILLVACVNLANLMLDRAAARSHEMSVRVAIGASRWSLGRQVLTESLALSLAGALLGLAFAYWGSRLLVLLMTRGGLVPITLDTSPDLRVLSVTICVALFTGVLFGLAPAWRCSNEDPAAVLQQNTRTASGATGMLGKALIITQVALSLVLLLGAGLFVRSLERLLNLDLGFQKEGVLEIELYPKPGGYQDLDLNSYHKQLIDRISSLSGVRSVSFSDASFPSPDMWHDTVSPMAADPGTGPRLMAHAAEVSPGFPELSVFSCFKGANLKTPMTNITHGSPSSTALSRSASSRMAMPSERPFASASCPTIKILKSWALPAMLESSMFAMRPHRLSIFHLSKTSVRGEILSCGQTKPLKRSKKR